LKTAVPPTAQAVYHRTNTVWHPSGSVSGH
jgi:hypothetical protein